MSGVRRAQVLSFLRDSALRALVASLFTRDAEMSRLPPEYQKAVRGAGAGAGLMSTVKRAGVFGGSGMGRACRAEFWRREAALVAPRDVCISNSPAAEGLGSAWRSDNA